MHIKTKAATLWRLAFSISFISIFIACQDPGSLGGGFIEKSEINIDTIQVTTLNASSQNAYLGRLSRSATGRFQDDLVGDIEAISFFKPSIQRSSDTLLFDSNTNLSLRLQVVENVVYGDTTTTGNYSIYRVNSLWRGSAFRNSMDITVDEGELIGQFSDASLDSNGIVQLELSGSWKDDYINFFNMPDETRDAAYKAGDYGLAVVPDAGNSKVVYISYALSNLTAFGSDTTSRTILDWGVDLERSGALNSPGRIILDSTFDTVFRVNLAEVADQIGNRNFARAELELKIDTLALKNSLDVNEIRTSPLGLGLKLGPFDDVEYELGFSSSDLTTVNFEGSYRFTVTTLLNNYLFGEAPISDVYLYLSATSGNLAYTSIFAGDTNQDNNPKLIIYGVESGE
tara:strand:- start:36553 stop:37752 length:1200 start_codon:yes stop_codon:yes gene_type:complete